MRSRKEQLQAYQFLRRRIGSALMSGEPDTSDPPMQRVGRTSFAGIMVGVLIAAGFGVYGLLRPGGATGWQKNPPSLVIVDESGAQYVYNKGRLYPMLNYASARLYLGKAEPKTHKVSYNSLKGTRVGPRLGIRGAPDVLPSADKLVREPWSVCAAPKETGGQTTTLLAGKGPKGGSTITGDEALLVTTKDGRDNNGNAADDGNNLFLVWQNKRYAIPQEEILTPLGLRGVQPQVVGSAWLNALPSGPTLAFPLIPDAGQPGIQIGGRQLRVGQVIKVNNAGEPQYAVVLPEGQGVAQVSPGVASILLASPSAARAYQTSKPHFIKVGLNAYSSVRTVTRYKNLNRYPDRQLQPANTENLDTLCVTLNAMSTKGPRVSVAAVSQPPATGDPTHDTGAPNAYADRIYIKPGTGSLIQARPAQGVNGTKFLVSSQGIKYPIRGKKALEALGYAEATPAKLPLGFVKMIPTGPTLSIKAARQKVPQNTIDATPTPRGNQKQQGQQNRQPQASNTGQQQQGRQGSQTSPSPGSSGTNSGAGGSGTGQGSGSGGN